MRNVLYSARGAENNYFADLLSIDARYRLSVLSHLQNNAEYGYENRSLIDVRYKCVFSCEIHKFLEAKLIFLYLNCSGKRHCL